MISIKQGLVAFGIWILLMVLSELIGSITDKEDKKMELERVVQILDSIDSYALPGSLKDQQEREQALTAASYTLDLMFRHWVELKETITELRDNGGTATQKEVCTFLVSLMEVLENEKKED